MWWKLIKHMRPSAQNYHLIKKNGVYLPAFSLVEILIALGIFSAVVFSIVQLFFTTRETSNMGQNKAHAVVLISEYLEEIRNIRRSQWGNLTNGRFIIQNVNNNLELIASSEDETINNFHRYLLIENVYRDTNGNIVQAGSTNDLSSKKITVTVSWQSFHSGSLSQTVYFTRYYDNLAQIWDTEAQFNTGTNNGTTVVNNDDGEVILGSGGHSDWCEPELTIAALDLPKQGIANAVSAIEGNAFAGTGVNASGESFVKIDITNANPPIASIPDGATFNSNYKTNDIFGETLGSKTYGYIATDTKNKAVVILDITNSPYSEIGYFNPNVPIDGNSVRTSGDMGFLTQGNIFRSFYLGDRHGERPASGSTTLSGIGQKFTIVGGYAYIALGSGTYEFEIIDISNPTNLVKKGKLDVDSGLTEINQRGTDVFVNQTQTKAYLVTTSDNGERPEFYIIDINDKNNPTKIGNGYSTGTMSPKGVEVVTGGRAIMVGSGGEEYQVVKIGTTAEEVNPVRCGGLNIDTGVNDSASVIETDGDAYTYIVTGDTASEFKIIAGGPGGRYIGAGTYESNTLQVDNPTAFNRFFTTFDKPDSTTIKFQIAVKDWIDNSCSNVSFGDLDFVGPDGTATTFFTSEGIIPLDDNSAGFENPGQCFRFRGYFDSQEITQTPTLYDFTVNYSP